VLDDRRLPHRCASGADGGGELEAPVPEAMTEADIESTIERYAHAADMAIRAGFDGVELHAANGYHADRVGIRRMIY